MSYVYNGYHFSPEVILRDDQNTFCYISRHIKSEQVLNLNDNAKTWNYYAFFEAVNPQKTHDLFRCKETGKLYIPAEHELFEWI